ncbi:MAG: ABC transporter permease [Chloroflexi bacterium RBG_16_69_14]|nr:MAG: ABC transporter permease [Chloroflexi bacterium RBG_16_69_14]
MTAASAAAATHVRRRRRGPRWRRVLLHVFLISLALLWLFPILWTLYTALRPFGETAQDGYVSLPRSLSFDNFVSAWNQAQMWRFFLNTFVVALPGVTLTLFVSSMLGFVFSRFSFRANLLLLMMFTAGNLLPPQVIIVPLYQMYLLLPLPKPLSDYGLMYDSYFGIILIHIVFQTGFCTFVLSNYMKTISRELTEAALVDGASIWMIYRKVVLPLTRPALAAMATLLFVFIYNDFFWALMLMKSGDKRPITSALNNLQGAFFTNYNQLAAAAFLVALPTIIVYLVLSKQFVRGLTLGSTKG